jgi:hypothetical protein
MASAPTVWSTLIPLTAAPPLSRTTADFWFLRKGGTDGNRLRIAQALRTIDTT